MSWTLLRIVLGYSMKALSHLFHSPSGVETWQRCSAELQCCLPCTKYLFIQTGPLERKKAMRGCTRSLGHQSAEPAAVWWHRRSSPSTLSLWKENWSGRIWLWSHSLRKGVCSAPPLEMCLPLSIFNKSCIPTEALSWAVFVAQPWVILHVSLALSTFALRFNTLLYINNPVIL